MNNISNFSFVLRLKRLELKLSDVPLIVFEYGSKWFELCKGKSVKRVCGARKKTGERCRSKLLHRGGKCRFHGGLSTGAKSPEGKAKSIAARMAGRDRWIQNRAMKKSIEIENAMRYSYIRSPLHCSGRLLVRHIDYAL